MSRAPRPTSGKAALPAEQPTAIPERGEGELELDGVRYRLRPSHAAIRAIERRTDRSLLALVRMGNVGDLPLASLGIIAAELIRAGAEDEMTRSVSADHLEELILEEGIPGANARLTLVLLDAATGGRTASGEVKAAAA